MVQKMKAIVVGAGITGVSSALWLQHAGCDVVLIDRVAPGDPSQTSYGNAGLLARCAVIPVATPGLLRKLPSMVFDALQPLFLRLRYLPKLLPWAVPFLKSGAEPRMKEIAASLNNLTFDTVEQHRAISNGTAAAQFVREGAYTYLYNDRDAMLADEKYHQMRSLLGSRTQPRDRAYLETTDPELSPRYQAGMEFPDHGWITDPAAYVAALARHFVAEGGVMQQAEVSDIAADGEGGIVHLTDGSQIAGDRIVLAAGVWSRKLAERFGHKVNMESERGYHLMLRGTNVRPPHPYMIAEGKFAVTPMADGIRFAGTVEMAGLDAPPSEKPFAMLERYINRVYPNLTYERADRWMGHRPSTSDSLPLLGASPKAPQIIFAFGSQHIGLTIGPRLGRVVADIATGMEMNTDLSAYRVDRFD